MKNNPIKNGGNMELKQDYGSPRWSGEICDCSMPLTFDTYSTCAYNCLYCFAYFQKSHNIKGYKGKSDSKDRYVRSVNPEKIKKMFINCLNDNPQSSDEKQVYPYIKNRITMQWGGMADGFDDWEKEYGISLELLKFFDEIDYPLSISTKGAWWTKDPRYMNIIKKHKHNWHFKISIITLDEIKASVIEEYCPTPKERLKAIKRLSDLGIHVTLRLRPYIIGLSDDYPQLIHKASEMGADSVTTEFFCLETRAKEGLKQKYADISKIVGYNVWDFYRKHSKGQGYRRLNYQIKKPIIKNMKKIAHKHKMLFYVSDAHHKEKCDAVCCCGTPPSFKIYDGHFAGALQIAKKRKNHKVYWKDIKNKVEPLFNHFEWYGAMGFNTGNTKTRARRKTQTMADYLRSIWNNPKDGKSPYKYFGGVLYPVGLDEDNNVIYKYNTKKARS